MKATIKSIPVTEVTESIQVLINGLVGKIFETGDLYGNMISVRLNKVHCFVNCHKSELKTIVVEYEHDINYINIVSPLHNYKQLPLKQSDWQQAIDLGLVDSGKEVEVKIIDLYLDKDQKELKGIYIDNPGKTQAESYSVMAAIIKQVAELIPQQQRVKLKNQSKSIKMKQQTAIDWLIEQWPILESQLPPRIIEQAKEMGKKQIIDACNQKEFENIDGMGIHETITKGEQYYNETFNK